MDLGEELRDRLDSMADAMRLPRADLLRRIVRLYLDGGRQVRRLPDGTPELVQVALTSTESTLDIARHCQVPHVDVLHAVGSLDAGLATDPDTGAVWITADDARDVYAIFAPQP